MMKFILDIVSTPAILVALIAILGLVLQKKKLPDIIKGGIKTFVGFLVVSGGAGIVQNSLNPFGTMFEHAFHLSGVVPHFFCGATAGVIGNASGGVRGATIGAFLQGILISFLPVFLMPVLGGLGFQGSTFSDADFGLSGIILGMLNQFGSQAGIVIGLVLILAVMFGVSFIKKPSAKEE